MAWDVCCESPITEAAASHLDHAPGKLVKKSLAFPGGICTQPFSI